MHPVHFGAGLKRILSVQPRHSQNRTCYNRSCILFRLIASVEVLCKSAEDAGCKNPPTPSRISAVLKPTITL